MNDIYGFLTKRSEALATHLRQEGFDFPDASYLRSCVRTLDSSPTLFLDADQAPEPEINPEKNAATFIISTPAKDRMGDIIIPAGCLALLHKNYSKNPRVFFSHKSANPPIGSARHPDGSLAVEVLSDCIKSTCYFNLETEESRLIYRMVCRKELQAASIGFLPVKAALITPQKEPNRPETDENGDDLIYFRDGSGWFPSLRFHEWDLTEWSIVPVPANAECISMHLSRGHIEGEKLTDSFRKSLEPWAFPRKIWSPGSELPPQLPLGVPAGENIVEEKKKEEPEIKHYPPMLVPEQKDMSEDFKGPDQTTPVPAPSPEDPYKGWKHGAKFLHKAICSLQMHCAMVDQHEPELDNPKVKKAATRHKSQIQKRQHKLKSLAYSLYPEKFEDPGASPEEPMKSLPAPIQTATPEEQEDWDDILLAVSGLQLEHMQRAEQFFEATGQRI